MPRVIAAVMTLAYGALVALHLLPEGVLAAGEYDAHGDSGRCCGIKTKRWVGVELILCFDLGFGDDVVVTQEKGAYVVERFVLGKYCRG